jgi:hypothetical protein
MPIKMNFAEALKSGYIQRIPRDGKNQDQRDKEHILFRIPKNTRGEKCQKNLK